MDFNKKKKR